MEPRPHTYTYMRLTPVTTKPSLRLGTPSGNIKSRNTELAGRSNSAQ